MDTEKPAKIIITGKVNYTEDITSSQAAQIIQFVESTSGHAEVSNAAAPTSRLGTTLIAPAMSARATTPREAIDQSRAKTNPEKLVAFAGLILNEGQKDTFMLDDIKPLFRRAREAAPANLSRDLDSAVRAGWMADGEEKGEYYLTEKAMSALEQGFRKESGSKESTRKPTKKATSGRKSKRSTAEVPEVFKAVDPIPTEFDGVTKYSALPTVRDRFLWVLYLAKQLNIDGLSNQEIVWITDHLGSGIPANNINRNYTACRDAGHVNKSTITKKIRITEDGATHLKTLLGKGK